jgi:hypothetical protein
MITELTVQEFLSGSTESLSFISLDAKIALNEYPKF